MTAAHLAELDRFELAELYESVNPEETAKLLAEL